MSVKNTSGICPAGYRVLVKPDPVEERTAGGIVIPETSREEHSRAQATGRLVACGEWAWKDWRAPWAKAGDRVLYSKYSGVHMRGEDGQLYRLLNDEAITAVISETLDLSEFAKREKVK